MNPFTLKSWSPYIVGVLIGLLLIASFYISDKALGASTTYMRTAGSVVGVFAENRVKDNAVWKQDKYSPDVDWQFMLVAGIFAGSFLSAILSGDAGKRSVPGVWERRFGPSKLLRWSAAFIGAGVMVFGARLASGCTTGHGLSGGSQMAASGWLFLLVFAAAGIVTALLVYGREV